MSELLKALYDNFYEKLPATQLQAKIERCHQELIRKNKPIPGSKPCNKPRESRHSSALPLCIGQVYQKYNVLNVPHLGGDIYYYPPLHL